MTTVKDLHRTAMDYADSAEEARYAGNAEEAKDFTHKAFECERQAALLVASDIEPSRSVLHRSAAVLALECHEFREAERLICSALVGNPPESIANELRNLLEQVHFERHLRLQGIVLDNVEVQLSLAGKAVGYGFAVGDVFINRIGQAQKLVFRTAERKLKRPYRSGGKLDYSLRDSMQACVSIPRPNSFAISLRFGRPVEEERIPGLEFGVQIIDEVLSCLELFSEGKFDELRNRIEDTAYYNNFVGLVNQLAPDGNEVSLVGITALRLGKERRVALTARREFLIRQTPVEPREILMAESEIVEVRGRLLLADSSSRKKRRNSDWETAKIAIFDDDGHSHPIIVPAGMMNDIVKPLWGELVVIKGTASGKAIELLDIQRAAE